MAVFLLLPRPGDRPPQAPSPAPSTGAPASALCESASERPYSTNGVEQGTDGSIAACLRVGPLAAGQYVLALETLRDSPLDPPPPSPDAWMRLLPESGPPGVRVKISGYVPNTTADQRRVDHVRLCWAGCEGLIDWVSVRWSPDEPGRFESEFRVPSAPWLGSRGVQPLAPGSYRVVLDCIPNIFSKPKAQCETAQLDASFRLTGPPSSRCQPGQPCASLTARPAEGSPGALVEIQGWAPLRAMGHSGYFQLALQPLDNPPTQFRKASGTILVTSTPFKVTGPPGWSALGPLHPLWTLRSGMEPIAVAPGNPKRLAYCVEGGIRHSTDGGASWSAVPVDGVAQASAATNYPVPSRYGYRVPICTGLALDSRNPNTLYAVFTSVPRNSAPYPFFYVGYVTADGGRTWKPVPVADGSEMGLFAGFRAQATATQALFWLSQNAAATATGAYAVQHTSDGGVTWTDGRLTCPTAGPCLMLGPQSNGRCQAVGQWQPIERSLDGGQTWTVSPWPSRLAACWTAQLVGLGPGLAARVDGRDSYALVITRDSGRTWETIALPSVQDVPAGSPPTFPRLQMLPDGRLLSLGTTWHLLNPGAGGWCAVQGAPAMSGDALSPVPLPAGDRLWWVPPPSSGSVNLPSTVMSFPLSSVRC